MSAKELNKRRGSEPHQGDLNLDEPVPTLLTPVDDVAPAKGAKNGKAHAPPRTRPGGGGAGDQRGGPRR